MQIQGETSINKLILLFVFDKMESALSERTLVDMCATSNDWINYMDCVMMISQLLEDGFICTVETNDDTLYNSAKYRNRQECKSDYYQNKDGTYTVFLRILAPAQPMLELKFVVPDRKTAQNIYKKWELKAADVYAVIYENLVD